MREWGPYFCDGCWFCDGTCLSVIQGDGCCMVGGVVYGTGWWESSLAALIVLWHWVLKIFFFSMLFYGGWINVWSLEIEDLCGKSFSYISWMAFEVQTFLHVGNLRITPTFAHKMLPRWSLRIKFRRHELVPLFEPFSWELLWRILITQVEQVNKFELIPS